MFGWIPTIGASKLGKASPAALGAVLGGAAGTLVGGPPGGAAGAALGGQIGGGISSANAQDKANDQNVALAREQMQFQERMSSSAHQRQVEDMRKAGLNPMLSANQGGASAPAGQNATLQPVDRAKGLGAGLQSAMAMQDMNMQLANSKSGIALQSAQALNAAAQAEQGFASAEATRKGLPVIHERARAAKAEADAEISEADYRKGASSYDKEALWYSRPLKNITDFIGGITDAVNLRRIMGGNGPPQRGKTVKPRSQGGPNVRSKQLP